MYKHYIKVDENNNITDAFSSGFQQSQGGEILVADTNERHFNLQILDEYGNFKWKWEDPDIIEVVIPARPSEYYDWNGSAWVVTLTRAKESEGAFLRNTTKEILSFSSCIVHRHIDEIADGGSKRMTDEQYNAELAHRREIREYVDGRIVALEGATQLDDIMNIHDDIAGKLIDEKTRYSC